MINCPNCNHQNPDGALQCEACYTPLPSLANCPNCNASIQADASFCGQCGSDLREEAIATPSISTESSASTSSAGPDSGAIKTQNFLDPSANSSTNSASGQEIAQATAEGLPDLIAPDPLVEPEPIGAAGTAGSFKTEASIKGMPQSESESESESEPALAESEAAGAAAVSGQGMPAQKALIPEVSAPAVNAAPTANEPVANEPAANIETNAAAFITEPEAAPSTPPAMPTPVPTPAPSVPTIAQTPPRASSATQLQVYTARLRQVQTETTIEIPRQLSVVRIGKPNDHTPPDIDVSGFPDSEIVSRVHANLRVEGDTYYLEDTGSSNGTYINGLPLPVGNRHRLRPGDRIALGKGDKVSFIFENS